MMPPFLVIDVFGVLPNFTTDCIFLIKFTTLFIEKTHFFSAMAGKCREMHAATKTDIRPGSIASPTKIAFRC